MPKINPTAFVDPAANIGDDVEIGPFCVVEADAVVGRGTVLREGAVVRRYTSLGEACFVDSYTVLGGMPQDLKFDPATVSYLRIGSRNIFREHCTMSRATTPGNATTIGDDCYFMTGAHVGHDSTVEDGCIMVNRSALAGHVRLGRKAILSAHSAVHQFCWVGQMVMTQGNTIMTQHVPPFVMTACVNKVVGLNTVGLRRSKELTEVDRRQVKEAFHMLYRRGLKMSDAMAQMELQADWGQAASQFRDFVRQVLTASKPHNRGIMGFGSAARSEE